MKTRIYRSIIILWKVFPFKKSLAAVIKRSTYLTSKLYQDLRYKGIMRLSVQDKELLLFNPGFTTIENEIFWKGLENGWEKESMKLWKNLAIHSNVILDIGANSGIYTMVASVVNPKAHIFSFEPVIRTSKILKENMKVNGSKNISFFEVAVSNNSGLATFYDVTSESQYSASLNADILSQCENQVSYSIEVVKLDDFEPLSNKKIDLIKMDVEMHEPEAIEGMVELIRRDKPSILIEILTKEIGSKINDLLGDLGYFCYSIDEENKPKRIPSVQQSDFHNIVLLQPDKINELNLRQ